MTATTFIEKSNLLTDSGIKVGPQQLLFAAIAEEQGQAITVLARSIGLTGAHTRNLLDSLEKLKLVFYVKPLDRRKTLVCLSPIGDKIAKETFDQQQP